MDKAKIQLLKVDSTDQEMSEVRQVLGKCYSAGLRLVAPDGNIARFVELTFDAIGHPAGGSAVDMESTFSTIDSGEADEITSMSSGDDFVEQCPT